jgi:hypothetical protein
MTKKKGSTPTKEAEKAEEAIVEKEPQVAVVKEVIPESPEETAPPEPESPVVHEESAVEKTVKEVAEGMVKLEIIKGSVGFQGPQGVEWHEKGETITVPIEIAEKIDKAFIKVV